MMDTTKTTKTLRWYGSSDDTFGYEIGTTGIGDDHDNCANGSLMMFRVESSDGSDGLIVTGQYAPEPTPDGTWVVGITLLAEDLPLPNWPMHWETGDLGYSPMLVMEVPDDVIITDLLLEACDEED